MTDVSPLRGTIDPDEVDRFARLAEDWWNPHGKFRPLHKLGPARLAFLRARIARHFGRPEGGRRLLSNLSVLDVGCGGGLVSEPLARLGATVTGIDPSDENVAVARRHAEAQGLTIDYRTARVEELASSGVEFDAVVCLEVLEHVPDQQAFIETCAALVRPGGLLLLSTINRTLKAFALAIVGAEYILHWLPVGTHRWERFVTPEEMERYCAAAGLDRPQFEGLVYSPFSDLWSLGPDLDVNYMAAAAKRSG